ncbi:hypothetical protein EDB81DRAFT_191634 [Dactylonectria macrodidyma]|uniref:Uncharacterized protein n=1 Tax=Dactylonectria macrodidyma TaxID=307937 RepID=A0A9P9FRP7_9HYPO|nr:hypothetical protein EDB81DRAFT_191634 [Dactylonectria macrodidyma]
MGYLWRTETNVWRFLLGLVIVWLLFFTIAHTSSTFFFSSCFLPSFKFPFTVLSIIPTDKFGTVFLEITFYTLCCFLTLRNNSRWDVIGLWLGAGFGTGVGSGKLVIDPGE